MKNGENGNQRFIHTLEDGAKFTFVEKRNILHSLKPSFTKEVVINNYATQERSKATLTVSEHEDSDIDNVLELEERNHKDNNSRYDEEEEADAPTRTSFYINKTELLKDDVVNIPITIQVKMETMNFNDANHKWGHHGKEQLRNMGKSK